MVEEVKTKEEEVKNHTLLDIVFVSLNAGKTIKQITKELKISKQKLQYYLNKLKYLGMIKKIGYGVWQTSKEQVGNPVRGHAFVWSIKLPQEIGVWDKVLANKKIPYKLINKGNTYQIYFKDKKLWMSKHSIVIYEIKSFFGFNAVESKKYAFFELRTLLNELQAKLGINLQTKQNNFIAKTSRQHYSLIKNALAIQCNKEGKRINVYNEKGLWFTIDNSFNLEEAETLHPNTALTDSIGIQKFFNELKETKFEVTPKFVLNTINQVTQNQLMFNQNFESHVSAIRELGNSVRSLTEQVKILQEENRRLGKL